MDIQLSTRIGTDATITWQAHMSLGDGFNAQDMQSAKSPLTKIEVQSLDELPANRRTEYHHQFIKNSEDYKRALKISVDGPTSVSLLSDSTSIRFLKDIECNSTHVATFITCTITAPKQLYLSEPHFTKPAREYLAKNGADNFLRHYGSHFVAGQICQSTFSLMLRHTTASAKDMEQLIKTLNSHYAKLVDMSSLTDLRDTLKKAQVDTLIRLATSGSTFTDIKAFLTLDDIVPIFDAWKASLQPEPYTAILKHLLSYVVEAYESLQFLQMKIRSANHIKGLQPVRNSVENLERRLLKIELSDSDWKSDLQQWKIEYGQTDVDFTMMYQPFERRQELMMMVYRSQYNSSWPKNRKMYPGQITEFRTGITSPGLFEQFSSDVAVFKWWFSKDRTPDTNGIVQKEVCEFGIHGDRIIIGIEAISERDDQHNNGWFTLRSGGVGEPYVNLFFETSHWRASEWSVQIWHVEKKLYSN